MNTLIRTMMVFVVTAGGIAAAQDSSCQTTLTVKEAMTAIGEGVAAQPVFAAGHVKGYRLYNTRYSGQLTSHGINSGDLMTHMCGVPANDIQSRGVICCSTDASKEFEVTFQIAGEFRKILIQRPPTSP